MVVSNNSKKGTAQIKSVSARLLVLGDKQVGKSASIVRYTTGRFIEEYSDASSDWLYRHSLGFDPKRNLSTAAEILEQKDIDFCNSGNFFMSSTTLQVNQQQQQQNNHQYQSLASRVALDQQLSQELQEKQEMLNKLRWADAYIVIYAINDRNTFNKAIKYLNLIANNINSPTAECHRLSCSSGSCSGGSASGSSGYASHANGSSTFFHRLSPGQSHGFSGSGKLSPSQLIGGASCQCQHAGGPGGPMRRPILLLGNKRDLERSSRQVSASDGRLLAMRHQSMFAEVSIAESSKLIESCLGNLIEQIDQASLHPDNPSCGIQRHLQATTTSDSSPNAQHLIMDQMRPTVESVLTQSSINLTAPIWGNLVKSKLVGPAMMAQSSKVTSSKLETSDVYSLKPVALVAKSVEVASANTKQAGSCSMLKRSSGGQPSTIISTINHPQILSCLPISSSNNNNSNNSNSYQNKYKSFKSSFKKASMAIVSSKTLSRSSNNNKQQIVNQKRSSTTSSEHDSIGELSVAPNHHQILENQANYHASPPVSRASKLASIYRDTSIDLSTKSSSPQFSDRFRRPLFRYKNRRTTVAFEEIGASGAANKSNGLQLNSKLNQSKLSLNKASMAINPQGASYESARKDSARSSSSLSTSDTNCSSSLVFCDLERGNVPTDSSRSNSAVSSNFSENMSQTASLTLTRHNSNATLSRTSTSGGSYDDSGDDTTSAQVNIKEATDLTQLGKGETSRLSELMAKQYHHSPQTNRKRYDLVKSVQSTLFNLTRSANITSQTPKRSFCSTLFRQTESNANVAVKKITDPPIMVDTM